MGNVKFPKKGMNEQKILEQMDEMAKKDLDWRSGKTWSLVYHASDEHTEFLKKAHNKFFSKNALNPMAFPSLRQFEAEVVAMTLDLLNGGNRARGVMTSGGTESNAMAIKTYRDWAREKYPEIKKPEVIMPISAHPSLEKGAHYFDVETVRVPVNDEYRADVDAVRDAITDNTILIVGSAPDYPRGKVDPIREMAKIAKENDLGMHVDSCLGGYLLPFLKKLGYDIPDYDLSVPGVTSISADTHKYGFAAKGASVLMFNSPKLQQHQFYAYVDWPGGIYASPSFRGTRPGSIIAAAWAGIKHLGEKGYLELAKSMMETTKKLMEGIEKIPELYIIGDPDMTAFSYTSDELDMYAIEERLADKGWGIDKLQFPKALHMMINPKHAEVISEFLTDLNDAVNYVKEHPSEKASGEAAIYGMAATIEDREKVEEMVLKFLSSQYKA
jgi:glutamate/tyrosine decarboxylase-like PLP-dependent enzyme